MADFFGGIFDGIGSLFDVSGNSLRNAVGAAGKAVFNNEQSRSSVSMNQLDYGTSANYNTAFNSSKTGAVESVNPDAFEKTWYARLQRFADVESQSGVKLK